MPYDDMPYDDEGRDWGYAAVCRAMPNIASNQKLGDRQSISLQVLEGAWPH